MAKSSEKVRNHVRAPISKLWEIKKESSSYESEAF
jgi:hypothetical protein